MKEYKDIPQHVLDNIFTSRFIVHMDDNDTNTALNIMEWRGTSFARIYWFKDDDTNVYLEYLSVDNNFRGNGIGTELQKIREKIGKLIGAKFTKLWVKDGAWMHDWYLRRGYKDTKDKDEYGIWMKKKL